MSNQPSLPQASISFLSTLISKSWEDAAFKEQLIKDPAGTLKDMGYAELKNSNGDVINIAVEEATSGETCAFDPVKNVLTLYLPDSPETLQQMSFTGEFSAGLCC